MKKILAIDDQQDNLTSIEAVLRSQLKDIKVITAISGEEGIEKAIKEQPDTIILDIIMPKMDGFEVCLKLKEGENTKHIPIIMLTAIKKDSDSRVKGLLAGADAFLSKPIDPIELSTQVKVMLRIKAIEDKLRSENEHLEDIVRDRTHSLYESKVKYKALYDNAPLPYQSLNEDGILRDINPAWLEVLGYERDEILGTYFGDILHPDWQGLFPNRFKKFKEVGRVKDIDFKIRHKDGHFIDVEFSGSVGYNSDGSFKQTYCVFQDVTKSNLAKQNLLESETYLRALIENSSDNISILDSYGNILQGIDSGKDILGYRPKDLINKNIFTWVHPKDQQKLRDRFTELLVKDKIHKQVTFRFMHKNGTWRMMEGTGKNMLNDNRINGIVLTYRDITEQNIIELEKTESDRKLNTLINNLQGIAYRCKNDEHWTMEYLSAGFESITGYSIDDILHNKKISFDEIIHIDDRERISKEIHLALKNKKAFIIEYRINSASGKQIHVLEKGIGIYEDNKSEPTIIEGFISDISESIVAKEEIIKLSYAVEQSPSVIVITDTKGNLVYANPKFTVLTGYSKEELIGKQSNILRSGEQSEEVYKELWKTIKDGKTWKGEFHNRKKDGSLFWESALISPILDDNSKIINFIKVAEDVTEQKKVAKALIASENKYQKLIETSAEGFWLINKNGVTQEVNATLCSMLGYNKDEIIGKKPYEFVDEENYKIFDKQIAQANSNLQSTYEIYLTTKNGTKLPTRFNATSISNDDGNFIGSFSFVSDISKGKRSEQIQKVLYNISNAVMTSGNLNSYIKLIQTELSEIIDTTNFFVALYDNTTKTLSVPFFSDEKDNIVSIPSGNSLTDYVIRTKKPLLATKEVMQSLIDKGELLRFGSSSKIWLGIPLIIENNVIGVLAVQSYTDENAFDNEDMKMLEFVSKQVSISIVHKRNEQEIIYSLEKAQESDKLKTAFLQNISHEIRTPMNGIMGFTSLLKDTSLSGAEQQSYLDVIMISGKRMLNTLKDLMDMSMLETGQVKMNICDININSELNSLQDFFKLEVEKKGMEIHCNTPLPSEEVIIQNDRDKLLAICTNLIKNAIKYSISGRIDIGYEILEGSIEVFVKDTGIGIPKNRLDAIFERFVQADIADVKVYEGTGLGLSISKAYIEMLGGEIRVDSVEGEGSQFYFTLPFDSENASITEQPIEAEIITLEEVKTKKILIAEDEEIANEYLAIILEGPDTELIFAKDGIESVEMCRKNPDIDLILMDIKLPKMNGYAATTAIRTFNKKVAIIAQTAYALAGDREKALEAGCDDYITKPINKDLLFKIINERIDK